MVLIAASITIVTTTPSKKKKKTICEFGRGWVNLWKKLDALNYFWTFMTSVATLFCWIPMFNRQSSRNYGTFAIKVNLLSVCYVPDTVLRRLYELPLEIFTSALWSSIFQARILEWVAISFSKRSIFSTQGSNPCLLLLLHWQVD